MKMKKIFSSWPKHFNLYFPETLNFAYFKCVFRFFISFFSQKFISFSSTKWVHFAFFSAILSLLWWAVTFDRSKIWNIWKQIFLQIRKDHFHFFHLHFSFSFSSILKNFKTLYSSTLNYLFNEVPGAPE